jgi:hypothetical protein
MSTEPSAGIVITLRDVWNELHNQGKEITAEIATLNTTVAQLGTQIEQINTRNVIADKAQGDHETRIRALERWRYALPTSALLALISIILTVYQFLHQGS